MIKREFKNTKLPGGDKPVKVITGGKAKLTINGREIAYLGDITFEIEKMREEFHKAINSATNTFRTPVIGEPLEIEALEPFTASFRCVRYGKLVIDDRSDWVELWEAACE